MHGNSNDRRALEREALRNVINQWNANRLDLFELSEPNEVSKYFSNILDNMAHIAFLFQYMFAFHEIASNALLSN